MPALPKLHRGIGCTDEGPDWAGRVSMAAVGNRLCNVYYLRIAAFGGWCVMAVC